MMYDGWMWGNGWGWVGWTVMAVVIVLFWGGVITAIIIGIRYLVGSSNTPATPRSYGPSRPEDVLADRFARGEIDEDEYRRRMTAFTNTVDRDALPRSAARPGHRHPAQIERSGEESRR
jgi:putative membrane protein